ncbi:MAG: hypothetical protein GF418_16555 [Chitinivibrionales bacterium]|nr:hypothetical protein [Chitinivibrionales bacterium]MBD3397234.1 hypothetical protein [Chitinivibrionales bacterium]
MQYRAALSVLCLLLCVAQAHAQTTLRRGRGEGFYNCESANTVGSGNVWGTARATGYIWDAKQDTVTGESQPVPQGFLHARFDVGLFDFASVSVESRALAMLYGKHPQVGDVKGAAKLTWPNNKDLRFAGPGLELAYVHSFVKDFISLGGYRSGGTGFASCGPLTEGGKLQMRALCDLDLLPLATFLPLKAMFNLGFRMPLRQELREFSQYLVYAGVAYVGFNFDVFVEYSFEGFFNRGVEPKLFAHESDWNWSSEKRWEVAFSENPMYISLGGRYRYPSGIVLYACVPLLISVNQGSTMELKGNNLPRSEQDRGITDGFDPWYAKWKLVLQLSFPFRYRQTGAEMRRNFLLLKNRKGRKKIDIDQRLKILEQSKPEAGAQPEEEKEISEKDRLEAIRKRREEIQQKEPKE